MARTPRRQNAPAAEAPNAVRCRAWRDDLGIWEANARVERFAEPALLLLLRESPAHGYELGERISELVPEERIDLGNLYRMLRSLEGEGIVSSRWTDSRPGRSTRTYTLTAAGRDLLAAWVEALRRAEASVEGFLRRYERRPHPA